jgi:PIN domain nuclease of toxin-antitoxin system
VSDALANGQLFMSSVNKSEVIARLIDYGMTPLEAATTVEVMEVSIIDFSSKAARETAFLRPATKASGLGIGDRACLALAASTGLTALTADRNWGTLSLGIKIELIR